jgi:hypothetical protein
MKEFSVLFVLFLTHVALSNDQASKVCNERINEINKSYWNIYHMTRVGHWVLNHGRTLESIMAASLRGLDEFQIEAAWETSVSTPRSGLSTRPSDFDLVILSQTSPSLLVVWHSPSRGPNSSRPQRSPTIISMIVYHDSISLFGDFWYYNITFWGRDI